MKNYIKSEIYRAIKSRNTLIAFTVSLLALFIAFLQFIQFFQLGLISLNNDIYDAVDIFVRIRCSTRASTLSLIAPLIASIIFSDSYLADKDSGFLKFIYMRLDQKKYIWIRILVNALISGLVMLMASLIMLLVLIIIFGIRNTGLNEVQGPFSWIFYNHSKILYAVFLIIISFIFNVIFSTLALGISPWIKNKYLTFVFPFLYYIISATIFETFSLVLGLNKYFSLNATILFELNPIATEFNIVIYQILLLIIGISLFYYGVCFKDEKNI